jgi:hypothetical protein
MARSAPVGKKPGTPFPAWIQPVEQIHHLRVHIGVMMDHLSYLHAGSLGRSQQRRSRTGRPARFFQADLLLPIGKDCMNRWADPFAVASFRF